MAKKHELTTTKPKNTLTTVKGEDDTYKLVDLDEAETYDEEDDEDDEDDTPNLKAQAKQVKKVVHVHHYHPQPTVQQPNVNVNVSVDRQQHHPIHDIEHKPNGNKSLVLGILSLIIPLIFIWAFFSGLCNLGTKKGLIGFLLSIVGLIINIVIFSTSI